MNYDFSPKTRFALSTSFLLALIVTHSLMLPALRGQGDFDGPVDDAEANEGDDGVEAVEKDPIVLAFRHVNPTTLEQLTGAVEAMLNIGRPDEGKLYLQSIVALNSDPSELADLARRFGSQFFLKLRLSEELAPEGAEIGEKVLLAFRDEIQDQSRLARLAAGRAAGEKEALQGLVEAGMMAIPAIVAELAKTDDETARARLSATLLRIGPESSVPLAAALRSENERIIAGVAPVLGRLGDARSAKHLIRSSWNDDLTAPTRELAQQATLTLLGVNSMTEAEAVRFLAQKTLAAYRGDLGQEISEYDDIWVWDTDFAVLRQIPADRESGSRLLAAYLATDLAAMRPRDVPIQNLAMSARLEAATSLVVPGTPLIVADTSLFAEMQRIEPEQLLETLRFSLKYDRIGASVAICNVIANLAPSLQHVEGALKPLLDATRHPNRHLQFAASQAVAATTAKGDSDFTASSRWVGRMGHFLRSAGLTKAIVADPIGVRGRDLAALLSEQGISCRAVSTGNDVIAAVVQDPDIEMIFLHERLFARVVPETLQVIRADYRSAAIPIAILTDGESQLANEALAQYDPLTIAIPRPVDANYLSTIVQRLSPMARRGIPTASERTQQAAAAITWLSEQTAEEANLWQLKQLEEELQIASANDEIITEAIVLLGRLANERSQRRLLELSNDERHSDEVRFAALDAFLVTIEAKGILLDGSEIRRQLSLSKNRTEDPLVQKAFKAMMERLKNTKE
jgi:hypothetical protein